MNQFPVTCEESKIKERECDRRLSEKEDEIKIYGGGAKR